MRVLLTLVLAVLFSNSYSQYYFTDIVSIQNGNEQYRLLRSNKIRKIKATSYEADNSVTDGFLLEEEISPDGKKITLNTITSGGKPAVTNRSYELSRLKKVQSSSNNIDSKTEYTYNDKGLLTRVLLTTTDTAMKYVSAEQHDWIYNENGQPVAMTKTKNGADTTNIEFVRDEKGMVVEENWKKKGRRIESYYYYYDAAGHLTDIVRYNSRLKKLVPDFQYEYDAAGHISQMTQISLSNSNYIIWKYLYNEKGLKRSESGFDKEKKLVGRIEYSYE